MEEIVVGARRVAMGDWMGDPDVTLGWGIGRGVCGEPRKAGASGGRWRNVVSRGQVEGLHVLAYKLQTLTVR